MPTFRYFDTSASLAVRGDKRRVFSTSPLCNDLASDPGVVEIGFPEWYGEFDDATTAKWREGAPEGQFFVDLGNGDVLCSLVDGEPVEQPEAAEQSSDSSPSEESPDESGATPDSEAV